MTLKDLNLTTTYKCVKAGNSGWSHQDLIAHYGESEVTEVNRFAADPLLKQSGLTFTVNGDLWLEEVQTPSCIECESFYACVQKPSKTDGCFSKSA